MQNMLRLPINRTRTVRIYAPFFGVETKARWILTNSHAYSNLHFRQFSRQKRPRSPYAILDLKTSATEHDIKKAFRKLAKQFHPDLNPNLPAEISHKNMAEIIQAYEQLMDDDFLGVKVGDGRVALACEIFTLEELKMDNLHDVYSIRILFDENHTHGGIDMENYVKDSKRENKNISTESILEIVSHPDDSVSDLKRMIQEQYEEEWGLLGRRMDRDKIRTGWELVCLDRRNDVEEKECHVAFLPVQGGDKEDAEGSKGGHNLLVMSYHLFVHTYGIQERDVIHAIVRKYEE